ncbi:hypothetical protein KCV07_g443, partial [Aureobasidium melanogenum]
MQAYTSCRGRLYTSMRHEISASRGSHSPVRKHLRPCLTTGERNSERSSLKGLTVIPRIINNPVIVLFRCLIDMFLSSFLQTIADPSTYGHSQLNNSSYPNKIPLRALRLIFPAAETLAFNPGTVARYCYNRAFTSTFCRSQVGDSCWTENSSTSTRLVRTDP